MENYFRYWGKAETDGAGWHLLPYHCLDVAAVGHVLLKQNALLRRRFAEIISLDEATCSRWLVLFLGLHDIGKFSESFQNLRPDLLKTLQNRSSVRPYSVRHDSLGNLLWTDHLWDLLESGKISLLTDEEGSLEDWQDIFHSIAKAYTGHHGEPPRMTGPNGLRLSFSGFFGRDEAMASEEFFADFHELLSSEYVPSSNSQLPFDLYGRTTKASWLMAGFAVLCDWIGSNSNWFTFHDDAMPLADYWQIYAKPQAELALREAGIGAPPLVHSNATFSHIFPAISEPTPLQRHVAECAIADTPQLFILEDVTGSGKTEAALLLAHRLMANGLGNGIFVALPTMATSNAMYERLAKVYTRMFAESASPSLVLAHAARHLSDSFMRSVDASGDYGKDDETATAQCSSWLADNRKKALLADVGVGTLDQALLAILPSRFQSLRLLGLAGHILIVDEVHAYDPYMNKLLQTLLAFHSAMGGSAILLSASLPMHIRQELLIGFTRGLGIAQPPKVQCDAYPLATAFTCDKGTSEAAVDATPQRRCHVAVDVVSEREEIERLIVETSRRGQCVCWISNTVHDALSGYESLKPLIEVDNLMLFHARFAMGDRLEIEKAVTTCFGRQSGESARSGKILIATQVVEQSLDLDFDLLVSDLAPMDLLIQRAGRLHRHMRDEQGNPLPIGVGPDQREPPRFIIHTPQPEEDAGANWYKTAFPKAASVYPSHGCLWLTARLLRDKGALVMPDDARELIEASFSEVADRIPEPLQQRDFQADAEWRADRSLAHINMLKLEEGYTATQNQWREDMQTPTRLGDMSTTVRLACWDGLKLTPWYAEGDYPWDMSQVSLRSSVVNAEAVSDDPALAAEIEKVKASLPDKGKWSVTVGLTPGADGIWRGEALNKNGGIVVFAYDRLTGVVVTKKEG